MNRVIIIRIGEIFLKGNNKGYFESLLKKNIKNSISEYNYTFVKSQNRFYIENYENNNETSIINCLKKVFGIHSLSVAFKARTDIDEIQSAVKELIPEKGSFRISCNRGDKRFPIKSMNFARDLGAFVLDNNSNLIVDLYHPNTEISVDIRENGFTYVYRDKIDGLQGMPVGCAGKGMALLSGGIDSPVAAYLMAKRGLCINAIHFHSFPYTSMQALEKVCKLAGIVSAYSGPITLYIVSFTKIQEEIHAHCAEELMITIMRRFMMRIAQRIAIENECGALITGESLGQVASQTVESITSSNSVVSMPVFRPLIAMDKIEIIDIANKIETYETSIEPFQDCCTVFLPKNPAIHPKLPFVIEQEAKLDIESLIEDAVANIEVRTINLGK